MSYIFEVIGSASFKTAIASWLFCSSVVVVIENLGARGFSKIENYILTMKNFTNATEHFFFPAMSYFLSNPIVNFHFEL